MASVLFIGASSDIARAAAHRFAAEGFDIILAARNPSELDADVSDLKIRYNINASVSRMDVRETAAHREWFAAFHPKPAVTVCAAGYLGEQIRSQSDTAETVKVIETNFSGCAALLEVIAAEYEKEKQGAIIGIASVAGLRGRQSNYLYGSAKAGFIAYLGGLRNRLAKSKVYVGTVLPGFVATRMTEGLPLPPALTATPSQVAADIFRAYRKRNSIVYTLWYWKWIMVIIRSIPEWLFIRLKL